ncbi:hypothetical protein [Tropicimonas sp. IMCC6043]|uniref:hypothetical protein n=1 Tax=Tropicimonas sp. IMCC6043 TaxID=2510645 RepID=UPI00101DD3DE|nr:hypothetical protein [Tropicimonas sp. IMCC6043]RYH09933.1 hypothetical protein EU800_10300 [Tropicimonas sp. IMCC6043]
MSLLADILLIAGALGAAFYCFVLSRRLTRFTNLENGMGGAVAVLSVQVDEMTKALEQARSMSKDSAESLQHLTERAEAAAARIELVLASMHDLEEPPPPSPGRAPRGTVRRSRRPRSAADLDAAE